MKLTKKSKIVISAVAAVLVLGVIFLLVNKNVLKHQEPEAALEEVTEEVSQEEVEENLPIVLKTPDEITDEADKSVYMDASKSVDERIEALLSQMSLKEKAAQMVQPEQTGITYAQITQYNVGSVLSGGGSAPSTGNSAGSWNNNINNMKQASIESRLGIPLLYGVDAVHGNNNVDGAVVFPHNIGLGAADDEELMKEIGRVTALEVRTIAAQWTFAPCVGNAQNELWGRTYECYGEDVEIISRLSTALLNGLQGELGSEEFLDDEHVLATAKHYLGEGYTVNGTNQGDVQMDEAEWEKLLRDELLQPYKALVDAGVMTLMPSYSSVNGLKCHENGYLINDILKGELGFRGLVVSDYNGVEQVSGRNLKEQVANSVNAGVDLLMEPFNWEACIGYICECAHDGSISEERIDDAVTRILRVKFEAGLFEDVNGQEFKNGVAQTYGSDEHREVARRAARETVTLLTNNETANGKRAMENLKAAKNITVIGSKADDLGSQCGGWTVSWQGSTGNNVQGTTLVEGLENAGVNVKFFQDGTDFTGSESDVILVVAGENPYAETSGDRSASSLTVAANDVKMLNNMMDKLQSARDNGKTVVLMLYTGRPVTIADYVDKFDAIVEAWLPGSEGDGLADVLVGDYDFTGTTTFTWPWYAADIETKFDDESVVLFKKGTGLKRDGSSIKSEGTVTLNAKPSVDEEALAKTGLIDLESTGYVLEAENYNSDSYLVGTDVANNYTFVNNWSGEWANAKWNVWVPEAGDYTLHFYIAAAKDSDSVDIYYAEGAIEDDGAANRTTVHMTKTADLNTYEDFTLDVSLNKGAYEFKFMNTVANACDFRLDRIEFELK
ncbi:MAG: glycoside hydrolase family 3 C-terminal domain-containing protein [Acetatifactor sp.]|nr:glycoside hydrolase family 3 C-terminal domain-containing protein [Acetatifactor sp.]